MPAGAKILEYFVKGFPQYARRGQQFGILCKRAPLICPGLPLGWRQVDSNSRQPNADPAATRVNQKLLGPFVLSASLTNKTSRSFVHSTIARQIFIDI